MATKHVRTALYRAAFFRAGAAVIASALLATGMLAGSLALGSALQAGAASPSSSPAGVVCPVRLVVHLQADGSYSFTGGAGGLGAGPGVCRTNPASGLNSATIMGSGSVVPQESAGGTCSPGRGTGTATVSWNTGATSVIDYTTSDAGAAVELVGTVSATSSAFAGDPVQALLAYTTQNPENCVLGKGLTSNVDGTMSIGSTGLPG